MLQAFDGLSFFQYNTCSWADTSNISSLCKTLIMDDVKTVLTLTNNTASNGKITTLTFTANPNTCRMILANHNSRIISLLQWFMCTDSK